MWLDSFFSPEKGESKEGPAVSRGAPPLLTPPLFSKLVYFVVLTLFSGNCGSKIRKNLGIFRERTADYTNCRAARTTKLRERCAASCSYVCCTQQEGLCGFPQSPLC